MGRVKELLPDDYDPDFGAEPDELEMLRADAELAWDRYLNKLAAEGQKEGNTHEPAR